MKKYAKLLLVILYPYAYIIWIAIYAGGCSVFEALDNSGNLLNIFTAVMLIIAVLYQILSLVMAIYGAVTVFRNNFTAKEAAKINMITKCVQIPAYIFHFIVGVFSLMLSLWGIGFLIFVIVVDVLTIILSGILAIGCVLNVKKQGVITVGTAVLGIICSFVYCVDVFFAIWLFVKAKRSERQVIVQNEL